MFLFGSEAQRIDHFIFQVFSASVEQLENWLSSKGAFLANQDLGVSFNWLLQDECQSGA